MNKNGNHIKPTMIRVCELKIGDKVLLTGQEYEVKAVGAQKVTCINKSNWRQFFNAGSQQYVELVVNGKSIDKEVKRVEK